MIDALGWMAGYGLCTFVMFLVLTGVANWRLGLSLVLSLLWPVTSLPVLIVCVMIRIENQRHGPRWRP